MNFMTAEQFGGLVRHVGGTLAAFAVGKGWVDAGNADWILGGAVTAAVTLWSWWAKRPA